MIRICAVIEYTTSRFHLYKISLCAFVTRSNIKVNKHQLHMETRPSGHAPYTVHVPGVG